jgi:hypothetical protein
MLIYDINRSKESKVWREKGYNFHPEIMRTIYYTDDHEKFDNITYIGTSPLCLGEPFEKEPRDEPKLCLLAMKVLEENPELAPTMMKLMDHLPTTHVRKRYMKVLRKCDKLGVLPDNDEMDLAEEYTIRMLKFLSGVRGSPTFQYNASSVNGVPWNKIKDSRSKVLMHKKDFVESPEYNQYMEMEYDPIYQGSTKHEFLPSEEMIIDDKQRVFFCGDTQFVFKQKVICDPSGQKLQDQCNNFHTQWSRYGFVKQYGGINKLVNAHLVNAAGVKTDTHATSDISGWDKLLPLLRKVWKIRRKLYGLMTDFEKRQFDLFEKNLSDPFICTPDGHIYQRHCGNVSGSGTTTTDNTIAHIIIKFYLFIKMFKLRYGHLPSYEEIVDYIVLSLYGDDDFTSLVKDDWFEGSKEEWFSFLRDFMIKIYNEFGLTIKQSAFKIQETVEGLEFLGSTFRRSHRTWLGEPRYGKIASSLLQFLEKPKTAQALCSTSQAVCYLLAGIKSPESELLMKFNVLYAKKIIEIHEDNLCPSELDDLQNIVDGRFDSMSLATGWEGAVCNRASSFNC